VNVPGRTILKSERREIPSAKAKNMQKLRQKVKMIRSLAKSKRQAEICRKMKTTRGISESSSRHEASTFCAIVLKFAKIDNER
jgi:hypothetical protein